MKRLPSEAKECDFWDVTAREEIEKLISKAEASLASFTQETYERMRNLEGENGTNAGVNNGET
jgi:hypothetical protein